MGLGFGEISCDFGGGWDVDDLGGENVTELDRGNLSELSGTL